MRAKKNVKIRVIEKTQMSNQDGRQKKIIALVVLELIALALILLFIR